MLVKELIEQLQEANPLARILVYYYDDYAVGSDPSADNTHPASIEVYSDEVVFS